MLAAVQLASAASPNIWYRKQANTVTYHDKTCQSLSAGMLAHSITQCVLDRPRLAATNPAVKLSPNHAVENGMVWAGRSP
jgi:hypothetical protein